MIITPMQVMETKIELTNDEYDILVDYKILLERMKYEMQSKGISHAAGLNTAFVEREISTVDLIMDIVSIFPEV